MSAKKLQFKRSEDVSTYTPAQGEPIYDIARKQFRIGTGDVAGGVIPKSLYTTEMTSAASVDAEADSCVVVDCSANAVTVALPSTSGLASGTVVKIIDAKYAASDTNTITVTSTAKINNISENFVIDLPRAYITFIWVAETENWLIDMGGIIIPSYEIVTTDELEWNEDGQLGIAKVSFDKIEGPMDLGTF